LTPLAVHDDQGHFLCIAIRDPETEQIVETVFTSYDLAEKADIPLAAAQRIFRDTQAAYRRLTARTDQQA
jgi:hypothetical protein